MRTKRLQCVGGPLDGQWIDVVEGVSCVAFPFHTGKYTVDSWGLIVPLFGQMVYERARLDGREILDGRDVPPLPRVRVGYDYPGVL